MGLVKITIQFENNYPTEKDFCFVIPFDTAYLRDALRTIDEPRFDSDPLTHMFCTNPVAKKQITIQREQFAGLISESIIDGLRKKDTVCGYSKEG